MKQLRDTGPPVQSVAVEVKLEGGDVVRYEFERSAWAQLEATLSIDSEVRERVPKPNEYAGTIRVEPTGGIDLRLHVKVRPR